MEVYEDIESDALDVPNATTGIEGKENEVGSRKGQGIRQTTIANRPGNAGIFKAANGARGKRKIETRQSVKDQPVSITALKLIAKQGADEKAELEQWIEEFVVKLTYEVAQLRKAHEETMQAQYQETENQRVFFIQEIEALKDEIKELKKAEKENKGTPIMKNREQPTKAQDTSKTPIVPWHLEPPTQYT